MRVRLIKPVILAHGSIVLPLLQDLDLVRAEVGDLPEYLVVAHHAQPHIEQDHCPYSSYNTHRHSGSNVHTSRGIDTENKNNKNNHGDEQKQAEEFKHNEGKEEKRLARAARNKNMKKEF